MCGGFHAHAIRDSGVISDICEILSISFVLEVFRVPPAVPAAEGVREIDRKSLVRDEAGEDGRKAGGMQ
jgi:hypothetical protein